MYSLEKYKGRDSRHSCPACGAKKRFTRYIDTETGRHVADHVGRCDRESSCGYHLKPKEYFQANGGSSKSATKAGIGRQGRKPANGSRANDSQRVTTRKPDFIEKGHLIASLSNYKQNDFVQFLSDLFPFDPETAEEAVSEYKIGTGPKGEAIFWQIDSNHKIRSGKLMAFDRATGNRRKDRSPNWIHSVMKRAGQLPNSFELQQCFFGEHLISKYPDRPIAIVEAAKTAVIASLCNAVFPDFVWIACGGLSSLKAENILRIAKGRKVILYPDANGFDRWQAVATETRKTGIDIHVSDLLERLATVEQKRKGLDIADYLIEQQRRRNDPEVRAVFRDLINERIAIMMSDGGLTQNEAEAGIIAGGFYQEAIQSAIRMA